MKLEHVLLILLLSAVALFLWLWTIDAPPHATGLAHPEHLAMNLAGDGEQRSHGVLLPALIFALIQVGLFTGLLLLGIRRPGQSIDEHWTIVLVGAAYGLIFVGLFISYTGFLRDPLADRLLFGLPGPTAWMMIGVWWTPLVLVWLYARRFDRWVYSEADHPKVEALVALRNEADRGSDPQ